MERTFGGKAYFIDRSDINTDEIIPAKYLTEISKQALAPHLLEDLRLEDGDFDPASPAFQEASVLVTRANFGCGSSREHAVWALEVNGFNTVIAESFARIFRQNMFNTGILAIELSPGDLEALFELGRGGRQVEIDIDLDAEQCLARAGDRRLTFGFRLNPFDRELVAAGGWLAYADAKY